MKIIIIALFVLMIPTTVFAQEYDLLVPFYSDYAVPDWYAQNIGWYFNNKITSDEFHNGLAYFEKIKTQEIAKLQAEMRLEMQNSTKNYETTVNTVGRYTVDFQAKLPHLLDATDDQDCLLKARSDDGRISSLEKGYCEQKDRIWMGCERDDYTPECGYGLTENKYYTNYEPEKRSASPRIEGMSQQRMNSLMEYYGNQWYESGMSMSALDRYSAQFLNDINRAYGIK